MLLSQLGTKLGTYRTMMTREEQKNIEVRFGNIRM